MAHGLDYETFSDVELGGPDARGLSNYVNSPNFRVLCASFARFNRKGEAIMWTHDFVFNILVEGGEGYDYTSIEEYTSELRLRAAQHGIVAHNAGFERTVSEKIAPGIEPGAFIDSAAEASMLGADRSLYLASRQLLADVHKLEEGAGLIQLFCVPNSKYPNGPTPELIKKHGDMESWMLFIKYCEIDALSGLLIHETTEDFARKFRLDLKIENENELTTFAMNKNGWHVDMPLVQKMKQRSWANNIIAQKQFVLMQDEGESQVNFNSHQQLKKYCAERGVTYKSLDKYHLPMVLDNVRARIENTENDENLDPDFRDRELVKLREVELLLETKAELGGSTLSKLPVILRLTTEEDDILRDQYLHVGAPQTFRTSGRGVQMQNLKKLSGKPRDMNTVYDFQTGWTNGDMAGQLRQVFTSRHEDGEIIVGDFNAVESRGLAWLAGEQWKLDSYANGLDVYKVLVTKYMGIEYDEVTDELRPRGKYSELSCGYQASAKAVKDFMFRLGFSIELEDALQNVNDWRKANPNITHFWETLDQCLRNVVFGNGETGSEFALGMHGWCRITPFQLQSMSEQHPGSMSLCIQIIVNKQPVVTRVIHGCYVREGRICYYKPEERKNVEKLWKDTYKHKTLKNEDGTPREIYYSIYGGKLAGILTQSLCRELFFDSVRALFKALEACPNALIVGQFHDEVAVDWWPEEGGWPKERVVELMEQIMSQCKLPDFPMAAEVKSSYRYIK